MNFKFFATMFLFVISFHSFAVNVDKMMVIADKNGHGALLVSNDKSHTYYIDTKISEVTTDENGSVVRVPYTNDNVEDWTVALSHPKFIVEQGRTKSLALRQLCIDCDYKEDKVYEITLLPKPYTGSVEDSLQSVNVFIGYAPLFIMPAKEQSIGYEINVFGDEISIHNKGNTLTRFFVDNCVGIREPSCSIYYSLINGRKKTFILPEKLVGQDLNVTIYNHDESYKESIIVPVN